MAQVYTVNLVARPLMKVKIPEIGCTGIVTSVNIVAGAEWYSVEYFLVGRLERAEIHHSMIEVIEENPNLTIKLTKV